MDENFFPRCPSTQARSFQASGTEVEAQTCRGRLWGLEYEAKELELNPVDTGSHGRFLDGGVMHSQGEELVVGKPGILIQVWGITWLRRLAQVGVSVRWARQASVFLL